MSEIFRRATLMMAASPLAAEMIEFFDRPDIVKKLLDAARTPRPPVAAISKDLLLAIPDLPKIDPGATRRIGLQVKAILDAHGFEPDRSGVRITDPLFATGSTYREKQLEAGVAAQSSTRPGALDQALAFEWDYLARSVEIMTIDEGTRAISILKRRFPELFKSSK